MATYINYGQKYPTESAVPTASSRTCQISVPDPELGQYSVFTNSYYAHTINTLDNGTETGSWSGSYNSIKRFDSLYLSTTTFTCGNNGCGGMVYMPASTEVVTSGNAYTLGGTFNINTSGYDFSTYNYYILYFANNGAAGLEATGHVLYNTDYISGQYLSGMLRLSKIVSSTAYFKLNQTNGSHTYLIMRVNKLLDFKWPELQVNDVLNFTQSTSDINLAGIKFSCRLKGQSTYLSGSQSTTFAGGANCYAEFDFRNVSDGNVRLGSNYGSYIALKNGTGTDVRYNRMMVAGDAAQYAGNTHGYPDCCVGGVAGLFNGSGGDGHPYMPGYGGFGYGGTQTAGGDGRNPGTFGTGGAYKYDYGSYYYAGGNGWYGGGSSSYGMGAELGNSGGGGSSYLLTATSEKPTGYFPEYTTYQPLISNGTSELLTSERTYYCTIVILQVGGGSTQRTMKYYNGTTFVECNVHYYDGAQWVSVNPHYYNGSEWV